MVIAINPKNPIIRCYVNGKRKTEEKIEVHYKNTRFEVPSGFTCDGSSIPRFWWRVVGSPTTGPNLLGGIIHDRMYGEKMFPRKVCDEIYYNILVHLGKPKLIAWMMKKAVNWFGKAHY